MDWRNLFLASNGRIGQKDFWIGFAILFIGGIVVSLIPFIGTIVGLLLIYPWICLYAKRLHDFGRSGWLYGIVVGVSFLLAIGLGVMGGAALLGAGAANGGDAAMLGGSMMAVGGIALILFLVNIGFLLWVGLSRGDPGENRYGPPPGQLASSVF